MSSNKDKFERDFDAFLNEGDADLSALYRKLPQAEPDAKLDAAVLAMAHRALDPQLVATPGPRRTSAARRHARWLPVLSAAATVVFAVGVAVTLGPQLWTQRSSLAPPRARDERVIEVRPIDVPAPAPEPPLSPPPPGANAPAVAPERQDLARSAAKAEAPAQGASAAAAPPPASKPEPAAAASAAPEPPPVRIQTEATNVPAPAADADALRLKQPAPATQAFPTPSGRNGSSMDAVERKEAIAEGAWQRLHENDTPAAASKPARGDNAAAAAAPATRPAPAEATAPSDAAAGMTAKQAAPPSSAPTAAPAAASRAVGAAPPPAAAPQDTTESNSWEQRRARVEAEKKKLHDEEVQRALGAPAAAESASGNAVAKPAAAQSADDKQGADAGFAQQPQAWIAAMQRMLRDGRNDELRRNLDQFRQRYPDYRLPPDLERVARASR